MIHYKEMQIKFWGVRGSIPHSLDTQGWFTHIEKLMGEFFSAGHSRPEQIHSFLHAKGLPAVAGFGTATTCVEVQHAGQSVIIDGGSGLKAKSDRCDFSVEKEFHILITHFHFDHILGLPFFAPHFIPGCKVHYYSVHDETETIIRSMFQKPTFPVTFESLSADIQFHRLNAYEQNQVNGFTVTPYLTDHPDTCYGFRIEKGGTVYAHAVDNEAIRITPEQLGKDAGLYRGADLVYFDAQYDEEDMKLKKGWGHGTSMRGFELCAQFGLKHILFAHHDPAFSIEDSLAQKKRASQIYEERYSHLQLQWDFAYEGQLIKLK